ncbi:uncharacterized protein LOC134753659 [Cydia strobilella]|uniref:uncharacterized protein LOC134753659 n=1 Tax=Cydia strobilella TaxID=1100964 RepID=UPI0030057A11
MPPDSKNAGDAPPPKQGRSKVKMQTVEEEPPPKTQSQLLLEEQLRRAEERRRRFKRRWPDIRRPTLVCRPWKPPGPPRRELPLKLELPALTLRRWVPPYRRRRRRRPRMLRVPPEEINKELYECAKLKKIWHNFSQVDRNKMMLRGKLACNSKRYRCGVGSGTQTACIAFVARALLNDKAASELTRRDVDEIVDTGDKFYHQCMLALKCYKGKRQLELKQLLTSFYFNDHKYTVKIQEKDQGILAKHPDNIHSAPDLMGLMEKRVGTNYMSILTVGDRHFLIWGHPPPPEAGSQCKTVCYIFDPHMQSENGQPHRLQGGAAFLRYAGVTSFVLDFVANYGGLDASKRECPMPPVIITDIEVLAREPLIRQPRYELDLKALPAHCESEWVSMNNNALIERKHEGEYPLQSLSAVSLATSRTTSRRKLREFYQKVPKEPAPTLPMAPEKGPVAPTMDQIMGFRGEDFFLYCPKGEAHMFGRDDMVSRPKSETILHSVVDVANKNFHSQYQQLDAEKWILRATRHMASHRYQTFKVFTAVPCCLVALGMLRRLRARAWNEDILDETLDLGYNVYRESLLPRGGPIRRLVLGEMAESFKIKDKEYTHKEQGIAVWGKLVSNNPKVFDLCRGLDEFFRTADAGILQVPGVLETAIWNEGGMYYLYHPWPADRYGIRVGLQGGGKACLLCFKRTSGLCDHFLAATRDLRRKPFSISAVSVMERPGGPLPEPINNLKPVAQNRWVIRGSFHEGDDRFPEEHRNKQATPIAIAAIAMAHVAPIDEWTQEEVNETLIRGDILYESTMENLEKMGISMDTTPTEAEGEAEEEPAPAGTLAAADVMTRFRISDFDCIETEVQDGAFVGSLTPSEGVLSLRQSLKKLFNEASYAVVTARGSSMAVFKADNKYYMFDPHGCDENGYLSDDLTATACLVCVGSSTDALAAAIESNLPPGSDDTFNISPVEVTPTKLNMELGAPEPKLESKDFAWIQKRAAAIMAGPRGEHSALGKSAKKAGIGDEDKAGRTLALPAVAAFAAATDAVPPPHMHQDHMFNCLDAGADYYLQHVKKTGNKTINVEDLSQKFEMGANTFSIELEEPKTRLPLRLPDEPAGEGAEGGGGEEAGEGGEEIKQIKDLMTKMWNDQSKPTQTALLLGDYHQLGVWWSAGGQVVAFDPAPTMPRLMLTEHRIQKGDEIRLQRIKDEMAGEGGGGGDDEEEAGGEGEQQPEPEPTPVPREATPVLMVFASPSEFIDKLTLQGPLDRKQCLAPYKLYTVKVINELTSMVKDKRPAPKGGEDEGEGEETEALVEPLNDDAVGRYMARTGRTVASVRGRVAQHENYFSEPARDNQDAAVSMVAIAVAHIEPYIYWKPALIDAVVKYGDRLYTMSLGSASKPPRVTATECVRDYRMTTFNVRTTVGDDVVNGDLKAGDSGSVLNVRRAIARFFESNKYGVLCAKDYCVAIWQGEAGSFCMFDPHSVGPTGKSSPIGGAGLIVFSTTDDLADTYRESVEALNRPGNNKLSITPISIGWEFSKIPGKAVVQSAVPDEGYECKVLTAYVEMAKGRTILRGSRPPDSNKFCRDAILQSAASAITGACMSHVRQPHLWTRNTIDQVISEGCKLFTASINNLGYEFRPGDDVLMPLQVMKRFILGSNYVRFDLQEVSGGRIEQVKPEGADTLRSAIDHFFTRRNTHGIVWCAPFAAAIWSARGPTPPYYMLEPHAAGPTGLRTDGRDVGTACVLTFTSPKLLAHAYLQNIPPKDRLKKNYHLYNISVHVAPIKKLLKDPPLVKSTPDVKLVPATSKVGVDGLKRRASEVDRKHPPGGITCKDAQRATEAQDKEQTKLRGRRNANGWLVLQDGSQFLSARHSIACRKFPHGSRGHQALACAVMAVAMSRVQDVCRWCSSTMDAVLLSGDQLYQDSYLHYRPKDTKILQIEQILRKFYTPGNCVCRVVVFKPRQEGNVESNLNEQLTAFFREERHGVLVAGDGDFAVALFKTPRGFYMFDASDRDRYGRAVPPPCIGHARACFSQYPTVQSLAEKLVANIPPVIKAEQEAEQGNERKESKVTFKEETATFKIYGMEVTSLRRLNQFEK